MLTGIMKIVIWWQVPWLIPLQFQAVEPLLSYSHRMKLSELPCILLFFAVLRSMQFYLMGQKCSCESLSELSVCSRAAGCMYVSTSLSLLVAGDGTINRQVSIKLKMKL